MNRQRTLRRQRLDPRSMFGPTLDRAIREYAVDFLLELPDVGDERDFREREQAFVEDEGPDFLFVVDSTSIDSWEISGHEQCPICGSHDVESRSFDSYGGTSEGYSRCGFCSYSRTWADLSAVI